MIFTPLSLGKIPFNNYSSDGLKPSSSKCGFNHLIQLVFFSNFSVLDEQIHISFSHWCMASGLGTQPVCQGVYDCRTSCLQSWSGLRGRNVGKVAEKDSRWYGVCIFKTFVGGEIHSISSLRSVKYPAWSGRRDTWTLLCLGTYAQLFSWTYIVKRMKHQQWGGLNPWWCSWWCLAINEGLSGNPLQFHPSDGRVIMNKAVARISTYIIICIMHISLI